MSGCNELTPYRQETIINLFDLKLHILDLSQDLSEEMPVYPGHMKTTFWWHLTHEECKLRIGADTPFEGYAVKGFVACDHVSTHVDAVYHFNKHRPDLTVEKIPFEHMITPAVWVDVSFVPPRTHISLEAFQSALDKAGVKLEPGITLLYYTGASKKISDPLTYVTQYPGLSAEASKYILDCGVVNVGTDAASTDNPADPSYPNHLAHGRELVIHTENLTNIDKIPRHKDFYYAMFPLKLKGATGSPVRAVALWRD